MAEVPRGRGAGAAASRSAFPTVLMRNVYVLPGVPEIFRAKFDALKRAVPRRADPPAQRVREHRGGHAGRPPQRGCSADFPLLLLGSYPEFSNPEYKVKVTLESRDRGYLEHALWPISWRRLPPDVVVRVTGSAGCRAIPFGARPPRGRRSCTCSGSAPRPSSIRPRASTRRSPGRCCASGDWITPAPGRRPLLRQAAAALLAHGGLPSPGSARPRAAARVVPALVRGRRGGGHRAASASRLGGPRVGLHGGADGRGQPRACSSSAAGQARPALRRSASCSASAASSLAYRGGGPVAAPALLRRPRPGRAGQGRPGRAGPAASWSRSSCGSPREGGVAAVGAAVRGPAAARGRGARGTWRWSCSTAASSGTRWSTTTC